MKLFIVHSDIAIVRMILQGVNSLRAFHLVKIDLVKVIIVPVFDGLRDVVWVQGKGILLELMLVLHCLGFVSSLSVVLGKLHNNC